MNKARTRFSLYSVPDRSLYHLLCSVQKLRPSYIRNVSTNTKQHTKQVYKALKDTTSSKRLRIQRTKTLKPVTPIIADITPPRTLFPTDETASQALVAYHSGNYEEAEMSFEKLSHRIALPEDLLMRYIDCLSKLKKYDRIVQLLEDIHPSKASSIPDAFNMALACLGNAGASQVTHMRMLFDKMKFKTQITDETFRIIIQSAIRSSHIQFATTYIDGFKSSMDKFSPEVRKERLTGLYQTIVLEYLRKGWDTHAISYLQQLKEEGTATSQFVGNALEVVMAACKLQNTQPSIPPLYTPSKVQNVLSNLFGLGVSLAPHHTALIQLCSLFQQDFMTDNMVRFLTAASTWNSTICDAVILFITKCRPEIRDTIETVVTGTQVGSTQPKQKDVHKYNVLLAIHATNNHTGNVIKTFRNAIAASEYDTRTFDIAIQYAAHLNRPGLAVLLAKNMIHRGFTIPDDDFMRSICYSLIEVTNSLHPSLSLKAKMLLADLGAGGEDKGVVNEQATLTLFHLLKGFNPVVRTKPERD